MHAEIAPLDVYGFLYDDNGQLIGQDGNQKATAVPFGDGIYFSAAHPFDEMVPYPSEAQQSEFIYQAGYQTTVGN